MIPRIIIAVGILLGLIAYACGHSFYEQYCCSGQDCEPIADSRVKVTPQGYVVDGRWLVPFAQARFAPDGQYHLCLWPNPDALRCFYAPSQGS